MSDLYLEPTQVYNEDPLGMGNADHEQFVVAFETVNVIYHGLITTPQRDYQKPHIQEALRARVGELASITNYSAESVYLAIDNIATGTYSTENDFFAMVKSVIEKIIEWLIGVKNWILDLIKRLFNIRTQNKASAKATGQTFKQAKNKYEREKKDFPDRIKVTIPGQCYLAFHSTRHRPQTGYVYNTAGLEKAITNIGVDMNRFVGKLEEDVPAVLSAVEVLISELSINKLSNSEDALIRLNKARGLNSLYHNKFEAIGFGIIDKPVRNSTRYFQSKLGLTNLVDDYGWSAVGGFEVTIETARFEDLNTSIEKATDDVLARIIVLSESLSKSRAVKRLSEMKKEQARLVDMTQTLHGNDSSITLLQQKQILARIDLAYELVNQLTDTVMLTSRFYSRYTLMLSRLMANIAQSIAK